MLKEISYYVPIITNEQGKTLLSKSLMKVQGIECIQIDQQHHKCFINYDSTQCAEEIIDLALSDAGFDHYFITRKAMVDSL